MAWKYLFGVIVPAAILFGVLSGPRIPVDSAPFFVGSFCILVITFYFMPDDPPAQVPVMIGCWVHVSLGLPPEGVKVVVIHKDSVVPCIGYWKRVGNNETFWVFPGVLTTMHEVLFWSDCIPNPVPTRRQ